MALGRAAPPVVFGVKVSRWDGSAGDGVEPFYQIALAPAVGPCHLVIFAPAGRCLFIVAGTRAVTIQYLG